MPNWHIKRKPWRASISPLCLHRTGDSHALRCPNEQARGRSKRRHHALEWRQREQDGQVQYVFETIQGPDWGSRTGIRTEAQHWFFHLAASLRFRFGTQAVTNNSLSAVIGFGTFP